MKAGVREIMRITVDEETLETLREPGAVVQFSLNDEHTKVIELVHEEETGEQRDPERGIE